MGGMGAVGLTVEVEDSDKNGGGVDEGETVGVVEVDGEVVLGLSLAVDPSCDGY